MKVEKLKFTHEQAHGQAIGKEWRGQTTGNWTGL